MSSLRPMASQLLAESSPRGTNGRTATDGAAVGADGTGSAGASRRAATPATITVTRTAAAAANQARRPGIAGTSPVVALATPSRASTSSAAEAGRSAGAFARHRETSFTSPSGRSSRRPSSEGAGRVMCATSSSWVLFAVNGGSPASNS